MLYTLIAFIFAVLAVLIIHRAINLLVKTNWFMGWLRGSVGMALVVIAIGAGLAAYDVFTYKSVLIDQPVATVSFESFEPQSFTAVVVEKNGVEQRFDLQGEQWQLDARIIKWKGFIAAFDVKPAYRLDKLSGRFYDIQKETMEKRTPSRIVSSILGIDIWKFVYDRPKWFPVIDASYGSAAYLPMKPGALYEVYLSTNGLVAKPLNDVAKKAVGEWD